MGFNTARLLTATDPGATFYVGTFGIAILFGRIDNQFITTDSGVFYKLLVWSRADLRSK